MRSMDGPVDEYLVDAGALRLSVRDHRGDGPPVVCLHGLASNARWWDLVAPRLAPRRAVAVDQRGHGRSDKPDGGYDFDSVVGDARAVVQALGLGPVVVAGHSWGASVGLWWAAADPGGVHAVVCVDGGVGDLRSYFGDSWEVARAAMRPPDISGVDPSTLRRWVTRSGLAGDGDAAAAAKILLGNFEDAGDGTLRPRLRVERHMQIAYELYHLDTASLLSRVTQPVMLILAARDGIEARRETASAALRSLPSGSGLRWIEGIHDLPVQRPAEVAAAMVEFLAGLGL
jgi:pimeloyl-ACP methyl ester carboxylesterase